MDCHCDWSPEAPGSLATPLRATTVHMNAEFAIKLYAARLAQSHSNIGLFHIISLLLSLEEAEAI